MKFPFVVLISSIVLTARGEPHSDHSPVVLENVVVSATPLERDQTRLATATTVLVGEQLTRNLQPTLGETLGTLPGVSSTSFGPGASRPVIRGLGGDRLRILANSLGVIDASIVSPDHAVAIDPLLIEKVEIIRGPAALLYGGNAIGGVVNVLDHRIHHRATDRPVNARVQTRYSSVDDGWSHAALVEGNSGAFSWHVDGYRRKTEDVEIPGHAFSSGRLLTEMQERVEHGESFDFAEGVLPNSSTHTDGGAAGLSVSGERGFFGLSFSGHNANYGIPPGAHGHHEEGEETEEEEHGDEQVRIDLRQRRVDLQGELGDPLPGFSRAKLKVGVARYRHLELEGEEVGTLFTNRGFDSRLELVQQQAGSLEGAVGFQAARNRFGAEGEEAFLPSSTTRTLGVFAFEEIAANPLLYQFGGRWDRQQLALRDGSDTTRSGQAVSLSAGAIWTLSEAWSLSGTLARNEREPNVQELHSEGPHAGTNTYERGDPALTRERSLSAELNLRRRTGRITGEVSLFAHRFSGFIFPEGSGTLDEEHGLEIHTYVQRDVTFFGAEVEALVHLHEARNHTLDLRFTADLVRAEERGTDESLPRITPRRGSIGLEYHSGGFSTGVAVFGVERARHLAPSEAPTPGYVLLNAHVQYTFEREGRSVSLFLNGSNLTDETARNHVSFLKDIAPLPGRNLTAGVQVVF